MSVYIPGMEMPKGCAFCKISRRNGKKMICPFIWKCEWDIHDPMSADHRLDGCPLVPVPEHGRLGDLDKLENGFRYMAKYQHGERQQGILGCCETIRLAPTIIPADPAKEGEG